MTCLIHVTHLSEQGWKFEEHRWSLSYNTSKYHPRNQQKVCWFVMLHLVLFQAYIFDLHYQNRAWGKNLNNWEYCTLISKSVNDCFDAPNVTVAQFKEVNGLTISEQLDAGKYVSYKAWLGPNIKTIPMKKNISSCWVWVCTHKHWTQNQQSTVRFKNDPSCSSHPARETSTQE